MARQVQPELTAPQLQLALKTTGATMREKARRNERSLNWKCIALRHMLMCSKTHVMYMKRHMYNCNVIDDNIEATARTLLITFQSSIVHGSDGLIAQFA